MDEQLTLIIFRKTKSLYEFDEREKDNFNPPEEVATILELCNEHY